MLARTVAEAMRPALGQQILVDNRPGAATNIGGDLVAHAKPDGYTVISADNAILAFNEHLFTGGLPIMQGGKVRVFALGTSKRAASLPNVPTLAEGGVANVEVFAFQGLLGPAGLPEAVTARLNSDLNKALQSAAVQKRAADFAMEVLPGTPAQFRAMARAESARWGPIIKTAGVKLD